MKHNSPCGKKCLKILVQKLNLGAIQITLTKISPNKAVLMNMYKDKETAVKVFQNTKDKVSELSKLLKMEINEGEVVFSQNSLTHE